MHISPEVVQKISDGKYDECGRYCDFFKLDDKVGVKLYRNQEMRDRIVELQKQAAEIGVGPEVYGEFSICVERFEKPVVMYGYFTEVVEVLSDILRTRKLSKYADYNYGDFIYIIERRIKKKVKPIFHFIDAMLQNIGMKNGRLVCIDFGEE